MEYRQMNSAIPVVADGTLPILSKGSYTSSHLIRWCAAQQNWDKIHYDEGYAKHTAGMRERVINGGLKQHFLTQFVAQAFGSAAPVPRLGYNFAGPDFINESLEVRGRVERESVLDGQRCLHLVMEIWNLEQDKANTTATALVLPDACWGFDQQTSVPALPAGLALDESVAEPDPAAPDFINALLGREVEAVESQYPLDMSRLRLFADAVGGLAPLHFDVKAGRDSTFGSVVAPPLFPIHALEATPGTLPLSTDLAAMGREAVNEVGRNFSRRFGFPGSGMVNGGNEVEIHSLLRAGETARATSKLVSARIKESRASGKMLMTVSLNCYFALGGRLLMRERQTIIYRNFDNVGNRN
jgi:hydroxyacyl-ACP dehydratase HTD2-like protein with hotdog domain